MTPSLRMRVVEAGARAAWLKWAEHEGITKIDDDSPYAWDQLPKNVTLKAKAEVAAALDAMLDCLAENQDEWVEGAGRLVLTTASTYEALLETLREDR